MKNKKPVQKLKTSKGRDRNNQIRSKINEIIDYLEPKEVSDTGCYCHCHKHSINLCWSGCEHCTPEKPQSECICRHNKPTNNPALSPSWSFNIEYCVSGCRVCSEPTQDSWEERFEKFDAKTATHDNLKDFISKELSSAKEERDDTAYAKGIIKGREQAKRDIIEQIKGMYKDEAEDGDDDNILLETGYDQALDDLLERLEKI